MPEIRLNLVSREWVIIAKERAKRPDSFVKNEIKKELEEYEANCPFCPGNESMTPPEKYRCGSEKEWKIRLIPNKFYALKEGDLLNKEYKGMKRCINGTGIHDVLIETPKHNGVIPLLDDGHVEHIINAYKIMLIKASENTFVQHVIIFKNYGEDAGTSIIHPHSQMIAIPVLPMQVRDRLNAYLHFYEDTGECLFCKILADELYDEKRIIMESNNFVAFIPYAALSPFHIWIFPKKHNSTFAVATQEEIRDLSNIIKSIITKLYIGLNDPSYNMVFRTLLSYEDKIDYFHWYVSIVPRVSKAAGFELGSGMFINTSIPEESAKFIRDIANKIDCSK